MENKRPLSILRYNAEKMRDNGAPQEYIAKYLADNGSNFQQIMAVASPSQEVLDRALEMEKSGEFAKRKELEAQVTEKAEKSKERLKDLEYAQGVARSVGGGLLYGTADEIESALTGQDVGSIRQEQQKFAEAHPVANIAGTVAGAIANPLGSVGMAGKGASTATKIVRGALTSGVQAGLYGIGEGEGDLANRLSNALDYAKTGAVVGGAIPAVGWGLKKAGGLAGDVLGLTTGTGKAVQQAYKAGQAGDDVFLANMRGKANIEDVVDEAKTAVRNIRNESMSRYRTAMSGLPEEKINVNKVADAIDDEISQNMFNKGVIDDTADDFLKKAKKKLSDLTGGTDGVVDVRDADKIKRSIQSIDVPMDAKNAKRIKKSILDALKGEIKEKAPKYSDIMKDYSSVAGQLDEVERVLSLGGKSSADTAVRKLQSLMREGVETNYGNRVKLADYLERAGGANIRNAVAGQSLSTFIPRGIVARGLAGLQSMSALTNPASVLKLALMSPRAVGESAYLLGRLANQAGKATARIPKSAAVYTPLAKALGGM